MTTAAVAQGLPQHTYTVTLPDGRVYTTTSTRDYNYVCAAHVDETWEGGQGRGHPGWYVFSINGTRELSEREANKWRGFGRGLIETRIIPVDNPRPEADLAQARTTTPAEKCPASGMKISQMKAAFPEGVDEGFSYYNAFNFTCPACGAYVKQTRQGTVAVHKPAKKGSLDKTASTEAVVWEEWERLRRMFNELLNWDLTIGQMPSGVSKSAAAVTQFPPTMITVAPWAVLQLSDAQLKDTVAHEAAHALAGAGAGHGPRWKTWCYATGANPSYKVKKDEEGGVGGFIDPGYKWLGICPTHGVLAGWFRRPHQKSKFSCPKCRQPIEIAPNQKQYLKAASLDWVCGTVFEGVEGSRVDVLQPDSEFAFHFTATWKDVQAKAKRIHRDGHVRIISSSPAYLVGEVRGDTDIYQTTLAREGSSKRVAMWECGCAWAAYSWGRSGRWKKYEGRMCSHALALNYAGASKGWGGAEITEDTKMPKWRSDPSITVKVPGDYKKPEITNWRLDASRHTAASGLPPEPGKSPIPGGTHRMFHVTSINNLESVRRNGLTLSTARGSTYGEPDAIWFSNKTDYYEGDSSEAILVEVAIPQSALEGLGLSLVGSPSGNMAVPFDIPPAWIVAIHEPWHEAYHFLSDPASRQRVKDGFYDSVLDDPRDRVRYEKAINLIKAEGVKGIDTCKFCGSESLFDAYFDEEGYATTGPSGDGPPAEVEAEWKTVCQDCGEFQEKARRKKSSLNEPPALEIARDLLADGLSLAQVFDSITAMGCLNAPTVLNHLAAPPKTATVGQSGVPAVDAAIKDFLKEPLGDWTTDDTLIGNLTPAQTHGACESITEQFVEFCEARGLKAYVTHTNLDELGYKITGKPHGEVLNAAGDIVMGHYTEHTIASIYPPGHRFPIEVDFAASQYGYTDHPKVLSAKEAAAKDLGNGVVVLEYGDQIVIMENGMRAGQITWDVKQDQRAFSEDDDVWPQALGDTNGYYAEVDALFVDPEFRRKGYGTILFNAFKEYAEKRYGPKGWTTGEFTGEGAAWWKAYSGENVTPSRRIDVKRMFEESLHQAAEEILKDEPEPALPSTTGEEEDEIGEPVIDDEIKPGDERLAWLMKDTPTGGKDDMNVAEAARTYLAKTGVKNFTPEERRVLIEEGEREGVVASNLDLLDIAGTHYEPLEEAYQMQDAEWWG